MSQQATARQLVVLPHPSRLERNPITLWASARTDATSQRRADLVRDKVAAVTDFFTFTGKAPEQVTALDVAAWQADLEGRGLAPASVYARISRVSSFYTWALKDPDLKQRIHTNPVNLARPKAPKAYQSESTKALDDAQVKALLAVVRARADRGDVVGKRDYALLTFYLCTGRRRAEVIRLRWGDIELTGSGAVVFSAKLKGGRYEKHQVRTPSVAAALVDYLQATGRWGQLAAGDPLWISHDQAHHGEALSSHGFCKNMKRYAKLAGLASFHLHQTRHTAARIAGERSGSMTDVQDFLGHSSLSITAVYLQRIGLHADKFSTEIADQLGL